MMKNKNKAIVSIAFWLLVLVVSLYGVKVLSGSSFDWNFNYSLFSRDTKDMVLLQEKSFDQTVDDIDIDWTAGSVTLKATNRSNIVVKEYARRQLSQDRWATMDVNNDTLTIESDNSVVFNFFFFNDTTTSLVVEIPQKQYNHIKGHLTSGNFTMDNLESSTLQVSLTSGNVKLSNSEVDDFSLKMTSGNSTFDQVNATKLSVEMTSGNLRATKLQSDDVTFTMTSGLADLDLLSPAPETLQAKINAGNVNLTLPTDASFRINPSITSGNFKKEFNYTQVNNDTIFNQGDHVYNIQLTSGNLTIKIPE